MAVSENNARFTIRISKEYKEVLDLHSKISGLSLSMLGADRIIAYYNNIGIDTDNETFLEDAKRILLDLHVEEIDRQLKELQLTKA